MGILYVVATPIGNLEDVTFRAVRVLGEVSLIAAEDTRTTRKLLSHYELKTQLTSYHEHNEKAKTPFLLGVLKERDVALVSEAGMPGISDPGHELISKAIEAGIRVIPIPGPSAVTAAIAIAGFDCREFVFLGFLPRKQSQRRQLLQSVVEESKTLLFLETPHRLLDSMRDMADILKNRRIAVCRELTKIHEEVFRGTLLEAVEHFTSPRGEFTLVVEGAKASEADKQIVSEDDLLKLASQLRSEGLSTQEALARIKSQGGVTRGEAYKAWTKAKPK